MARLLNIGGADLTTNKANNVVLTLPQDAFETWLE